MGRTLSTAARTWAAVAGVLLLVHLTAEATGAQDLSTVSQWTLMPALAAVVFTATRRPRSRLVTWVLVALGFSWLGDLVPSLVDDDMSFLVMVGFFLLAQVAYVAAFAPFVRRSVVHRRRLLLLPYAAALGTLVALCAPHAGSLLVPVCVYGAMLTAMAVLATGLGRVAALGGAIFLVSDALIALEAFVPSWDIAGQGFWVMLTYTVGQGLLAAAVLRRDAAERRAPEQQVAPADVLQDELAPRRTGGDRRAGLSNQ
ncbi:lysoplasmalogenase [Cellulomonas wangsupingiae]|uniref:Lysoplasmalogenase n=1 Tax=Cellulomonas wangsupingiae TaxID=2968085 RepID=A0ABY5K786_9CELL|nr:lysoplasmalogenase [Cellulomonas wangsupingiae]MCC2336382.1 lysoplasmalogenase [Cellulomonas wangsupingiae]UUI65643.1 lysoplasmalogenase [Cellulomonas wangsupingiae]